MKDSEETIEVGTPVEIAYIVRTVGYMFSHREGEIRLCTTHRYDPRNIIAVNEEDVIGVHAFKYPVEEKKAPRINSQSDSNVVPFAKPRGDVS
jgi:hypothetical protein